MSKWTLDPVQIQHIVDTNPQRMLEWGSGDSTKAFKRAGINITSIEHNEAMPTGGDIRLVLPQARTHYQPPIYLDWSDYIAVPDIKLYDTILVDGECRGECLAYTAYHNPDARVFLHDTQRGLYSWATSMYEGVKTIPGKWEMQELKAKCITK